MEIKYSHKIAPSYDYITINNISYIVASRRIPLETSIPIYKNKNADATSFLTNQADRICTELENISSEEDMLNFCKKYGTLINSHSPIPYGLNFRINTVLQTEANYLIEFIQDNPLYKGYYFDVDFIATEHFTYYVKTLQMITKLTSIIAKLSFYIKDPSPLTLKSDFHEECNTFIDFIIEYLHLTSLMLEAEYNIPEEGFKSFLMAYPFYHFAYANHNYNKDVSISELSNYPLYRFICTRKKNESISFLKEEKIFKELNTLFSEIYSDIVNFHMKNIPFSIITPLTNKTSLTFYTLGDAIIFQRILDETQYLRPQVCANKKCQIVFSPKEGHYQIYCTEECGKRAARNRYKQKKKKNFSDV